MEEATTPPSALEVGGAILRCEDCKKTTRDMKWSEGTPCPECGSRKFLPVTIIRGAEDYTLADRSKGFSVEDIRFGKIAVWGELITPFQYNQALSRQKSHLASKPEAPPLGQVMVDMKMLTEGQAAAILDVVCRKRPNQDDEDFGMIVLQNSLLDKEALHEMRRAQKDYGADHNEVPPIGMLMFEKRVLQENKVIAILKAQSRKGRGLLHHLKQAIEANREETFIERILGPADDPARRRQVLIAGVLGIVVIGVWVKMFLGGGGDMIDVMCKECHSLYQVEWTDQFPLKCKKCGKEAVHWAYKCKRCERVFPWESQVRRGARCPHCRSSNVVQPKDF